MKEPSLAEQIEITTLDVKNAMQENMEASIAEVQSQNRKKIAHNNLQQAMSRLQNLQKDINCYSLESINQVDKISTEIPEIV